MARNSRCSTRSAGSRGESQQRRTGSLRRTAAVVGTAVRTWSRRTGVAASRLFHRKPRLAEQSLVTGGLDTQPQHTSQISRACSETTSEATPRTTSSASIDRERRVPVPVSPALRRVRAQLAEERWPLLQAQSNCPQPPTTLATYNKYTALAERVGAVEAQLAQLSTGNGRLHQGNAALQAQQADAQQTKDATLAAENRQLREQNAVLQLQLRDAQQSNDVQLAAENCQLREQNAALHLQLRDVLQTKDANFNMLMKTAKALADKVAAGYTRADYLQGQLNSAQQQADEARAVEAALGNRVQQLEIIIANTKQCLGDVTQQWERVNQAFEQKRRALCGSVDAPDNVYGLDLCEACLEAQQNGWEGCAMQAGEMEVSLDGSEASVEDSVPAPMVDAFIKRCIPEHLIFRANEVGLTGRELGSGAFGRVLEGFIEGVSVAVKFIKTTSKVKIEEFVHEARAHMATVNLSGIVDFKGLWHKGPGEWAILQELMHQSLSDWIAPHCTPADVVVLHMLERIALCLQELHGRGFVHCDLKPDNILISATSDVKLGDLGLIVNMADGKGFMADGRGTPGYIAPEVLREDPSASFPADIFSFGVLATEALNWGESFLDWRYAVKHNVPHKDIKNVDWMDINIDMACEGLRPLIRPNLAPGVQLLMQRCWADDPAQRPTAAELVQELGSLIHAELNGPLASELPARDMTLSGSNSSLARISCTFRPFTQSKRGPAALFA